MHFKLKHAIKTDVKMTSFEFFRQFCLWTDVCWLCVTVYPMYLHSSGMQNGTNISCCVPKYLLVVEPSHKTIYISLPYSKHEKNSMKILTLPGKTARKKFIKSIIIKYRKKIYHKTDVHASFIRYDCTVTFSLQNAKNFARNRLLR